MENGTSPQEAIESDFLVRKFGFELTGFSKVRFEVNKENKKVAKYHKNVGGKIVGENDDEYFFECTKDDYMKEIAKFM